MFTLDSLEPLFIDGPSGEHAQEDVLLLQTLRDQNLICFIVMERTRGAPSDLMGNEGFLVDGIIELDWTDER